MSFRFKIVSILFFVLTTWLNTHAQKIPFRQLNVNDGLPSSEIYHVIQDVKGFIWLASDKGVSRYNGYEFINYDLNDSLPNVTVFELFEDEINRIWCVTSTGELAIIEDQKITPYKYNALVQSHKKKEEYPVKRSFYADSSNNVYISFENSVIYHISPNGELQKLRPDLQKNAVQYVHYVNGHSLYTTQHRRRTRNLKLNIQWPSGKYQKNEVDIIRVSAGNRSIAISYKGKTLYTLNNQFTLIDSLGNTEVYRHSKKIVWASVDAKGLLWLGFLENGAMAFKADDLHQPIYHLAKGESISSVLRDSEGAYWLTSLQNGLFYYPRLDMQIHSEETGLPTSVFRIIDNSEGTIRFGGNSPHYYEYIDGKIRIHPVKHPGITQCRMIKDLGGDSLLISYYGPQSNIIQLRHNNDLVSSSIRAFFRAAFKDQNNKIYGALDGIFTFNGPKLKERISSKEFSRIFEMQKFSDDSILLGTDYGLFSFNPGKKKIYPYKQFDYLKSRINCIHIDTCKNIWIGTKGKGLILIDHNKFQHIYIQHKLLGNSISSICRKGNTLWLSTNNGIAKAEIHKNDSCTHLKHLIKLPGIFNQEVNDLCLDDKHVYAATQNGIVRFNIDHELSKPQIYFTKFKLNNKEISLKDAYTFENDENNLEISFIGLSYHDSKQTRYLYKLEGIDEVWMETQSRSVQYPQLRPGKYTFKLKAINALGEESVKVLKLKFRIKRAFHEKLWFRLLMSFIVLAIVSIIGLTIFSIKLSEEKKRMGLTQNMNRYRQQALSAQMNPHFIHNSLNSIQSYILRNEREISSKYLSLFSKLMRQVLENSVNQLISLKDEVDALKLYIELEQIRFKNKFEFVYEVDSGLNMRKSFVPPLILQPYVENAIHHGLAHKEGDQKLEISLLNYDNEIHIQIRDNGIGRKKAQEIKSRRLNTHKSLGMEITAKRIELFKAIYQDKIKVKIVDLFNENKEATGTLIDIQIKKIWK